MYSTGKIGSVIYLTGSNFCFNECGVLWPQETKVRIGRTTLTPDYFYIQGNQILVIIPEGAVTGPVQVITPWGTVNSDVVQITD